MTVDPIAPGASRDPRFFVGRTQPTERAISWLLSGKDIALTDPRRLGKTYWLRVLALRTTEFEVVMIDYEGVTTAEEFLLRTAAALRDFQGLSKTARERLRIMFSGFELAAGPVTLSAAAGTQSPNKLLADTIAAVEAHAARPLVIAMDEVPIAIQSIVVSESAESAREVLMTLRSMRQRTERIRWIVAGSVGFHHVLRMAAVTEGALNDLEVLTLGPLTEPECDELAHRLFAGIRRRPAPKAAETLSRISSGIPFIMHRIVAGLQASGATGDVTPAQIDGALAAFISDRDESRSVTHLVTRLDELYKELTPLAESVLSYLAVDNKAKRMVDIGEALTPNPADLRRVIDDLRDDHYLRLLPSGLLEWRYDVLRRIWIERMYLGTP